eukprot:TRINITY_DN704_c0_g1_i2.p1 TRINITY_DN704_c0_g1~~TRINITY_DN704_c0_g1_i2.p1  ORF type:complete len:517 (+),score=173.02 TRINITY_DN704_c0_g1_i2:122-1552(+)
MQALGEFAESLGRKAESLRDKIVDAPEGEVLVRKATNDEKWGPKGTLMLQIADMTFQFQHLSAISQTLWTRLQDVRAVAWRTIYKGLLVLDYVLKNGSEQFVNDARHHGSLLTSLSRFTYVDSEGVDRGVSVRERATLVMELMHDTKRLREERKKAKANRGKFSQSISNQYGGFGNTNYGGHGSGSSQSRGGQYGGGRDSPQWSTSGRKKDMFDDDSSDEDLAPTRSSKKSSRKTKDKDEWDPFAETEAAPAKPSPASAHPLFDASTPAKPPAEDDEWSTFIGSGGPAPTPAVAPTPVAPVGDLLSGLSLSPAPTSGTATTPATANPFSGFAAVTTPTATAAAPPSGNVGLLSTPAAAPPPAGGMNLTGGLLTPTPATAPAPATTSSDPFDFGLTPTAASTPKKTLASTSNYNVSPGAFGGSTSYVGNAYSTPSYPPTAYGGAAPPQNPYGATPYAAAPPPAVYPGQQVAPGYGAY